MQTKKPETRAKNSNMHLAGSPGSHRPFQRRSPGTCDAGVRRNDDGGHLRGRQVILYHIILHLSILYHMLLHYIVVYLDPGCPAKGAFVISGSASGCAVLGELDVVGPPQRAP